MPRTLSRDTATGAEAVQVELLRKEGDETIRMVLNVERIENRKAEDIRILPGDRVQLELSPYDLSRGRITYRFR